MIKLLELFRFIRGFAVIEITGGFPERFLNLCNREKIYLWDTVYKNGAVTSKIYCRDFCKLRKIRNKTGVKIRITAKNGLHYLYIQNKKRRVLIYGLIISMMIMNFLNLFVWCIDVDDSENISRYELISAAQEQGLGFGTFVPSFDENKAGRNAVNLFNGEIIWAAMNIKGSKATMELRENTVKQNETASYNSPCNVVADFNGVIVSAEIFSGESAVTRGNTVKKGDLLISGITENADGSVNFHCADGRLTAFHKKSTKTHINKNLEISSFSENKEHSTLNFFSANIPLTPIFSAKEKIHFEYSEFLSVGTCLLPFGYTVKVTADKISSKTDICSVVFYVDEFTDKEYSDFYNTLILEAEYLIHKENDGCSIEAEYDCIDFIGKKSIILQEN